MKNRNSGKTCNSEHSFGQSLLSIFLAFLMVVPFGSNAKAANNIQWGFGVGNIYWSCAENTQDSKNCYKGNRYEFSLNLANYNFTNGSIDLKSGKSLAGKSSSGSGGGSPFFSLRGGGLDSLFIGLVALLVLGILYGIVYFLILYFVEDMKHGITIGQDYLKSTSNLLNTSDVDTHILYDIGIYPTKLDFIVKLSVGLGYKKFEVKHGDVNDGYEGVAFEPRFSMGFEPRLDRSGFFALYQKTVNSLRESRSMIKFKEATNEKVDLKKSNESVLAGFSLAY